MLKELNTYRGAHTRDVACAVWHPVHEELFCSGSQDGSLVYWLVARPDPQACPLQGHHVHCQRTSDLTARFIKGADTVQITTVPEDAVLCLHVNCCCAAELMQHAALQAEVSGAHEGGLSTMAWHPLGHMLATGSNDLTIRFWTSSKASSGRQRQQARSNAAVPEGETLPFHDGKRVGIRHLLSKLTHLGRGRRTSTTCHHRAHKGYSWHKLIVLGTGSMLASMPIILCQQLIQMTDDKAGGSESRAIFKPWTCDASLVGDIGSDLQGSAHACRSSRASDACLRVTLVCTDGLAVFTHTDVYDMNA